jgi:hypothetical protein
MCREFHVITTVFIAKAFYFLSVTELTHLASYPDFLHRSLAQGSSKFLEAGRLGD